MVPEENGIMCVELKVDQIRDYTRLSCSISNIGNTIIALHNTYVFLDQGIFNNETNSFDFPFLQKKFLKIQDVNDEDCIGSAYCKLGKCEYPSECDHIKSFYKGIDHYCECFALEHLSSKSILYMAPKETFSEELVLKLPSGVYRAILMSVPKEDSCDCMCCNRCFVV